jgi:hypothetical protein
MSHDPAKMPEQWLRRRIADLPKDRKYFAPPWALLVDENQCCWLDGGIAAVMTTGPNVDLTNLQIVRQDDGYHVWPPHNSYQWEAGVLSNDLQMIPVREVHSTL